MKNSKPSSKEFPQEFKFLTIMDVCTMLKCSRWTVGRMNLPWTPVRLGGRRKVIRASDLNEHLDKQRRAQECLENLKL